MTRMRGIVRALRAPTLALVAVVAAACGHGVPPSPSGAGQAAGAPAQTLAPAEPRPGIDVPPAAAVAVDGGDPVVGQLGSWTWGQAGSSSPWLPGAPIAVGRGETLGLVPDPAVDIGPWTARYVPLGADGPRNARSLATGLGDPSIPVPPPGDWTMVVRVEFAGGLGSADYAWAVSVR